MESIIQDILINASWAGATALFIWKVATPLVSHFIERNKNGGSESFSALQGRVNTLKNNHIEHLQGDVQQLDRKYNNIQGTVNDLRESQNQMGNRLTRLETIIERNSK